MDYETRSEMAIIFLENRDKARLRKAEMNNLNELNKIPASAEAAN